MTLDLARVARNAALAAAVLLLIPACGGGSGGGIIPTYTIGGTVSGLQGTGLVLEDNSGNDLNLANNGSFVFSQAIALGSTYSVSVKSQPTNVWQTCSAANSTGVVGAANVTNVTVTCVTNTYSVGGAASGLSGMGLVLENNAADDLRVAHAGGVYIPSGHRQR